MQFRASFPDDFVEYRFPKAVDIDQQQINSWIQECINVLESNKDSELTYVGSGNTRVIVMRTFADDECKNYYYEINVIRNFWQADVYPE